VLPAQAPPDQIFIIDRSIQQPAQKVCISFSVLPGLFQCSRRNAKGDSRLGPVLMIDAQVQLAFSGQSLNGLLLQRGDLFLGVLEIFLRLLVGFLLSVGVWYYSL